MVRMRQQRLPGGWSVFRGATVAPGGESRELEAAGLEPLAHGSFELPGSALGLARRALQMHAGAVTLE